MSAPLLIIACAVAGFFNLPALFAVPLTAAGLLCCAGTSIIKKIQRRRVFQPTIVASIALTFFVINSLLLAAVGYLAGQTLMVVWP